MPSIEVQNLTQSEMLCVSGDVTIDPTKEVGGGFIPEWNTSDWAEEEEGT